MRRTILLAILSLVLASCTGRSEETGTPTPPSPAVVSASGLDGYVATTVPGAGLVWDVAVTLDGTVWAAGYQRRASGAVGSAFRFDGEMWTTYTSDDGLPPMPGTGQARLNSIEVAPDGTVWAGTALGLARLDGETWTVVSPPVSVGDIAFAPDGSLLALTGSAPGEAGEKIDYALAEFDGETWTPWHHDFPSFTFPTALDVDPVNGSVWVGTGGTYGCCGSVARFDGSEWTTWLEPDWLFSSNVADLIVAPDRSVWVLAPDVLDHFDGGVWTVFSLPAGTPIDAWVLRSDLMALGPDGTIWIAGVADSAGNQRAVLLSFDRTSWTRDRLGLGGPGSLDVDPDGTLWVSVNRWSSFDSTLVRYTPSAE